jgi:hypothetical protein
MWWILSGMLSLNAWADAIYLPDEDPCPAGSSYTASHAYSYCVPHGTSELSCERGEVLTDVQICVEKTTHSCESGRMPDEAPCSFQADEAFSSCATQSDCERGTCQASRACVDGAGSGSIWSIFDGSRAGLAGTKTTSSEKADDDDHDGSSCAHVTRRGGASVIALLVGFFGLGLIRRFKQS